MTIKLILASTAALALVAGTPARAAKGDSQPSAAASEGDGKAKAERKICKTFDRTESRMNRERVCLTREGWKKFEAAQSGL